MADKKISALTGAATPLAGTEVLPIVQSGATVKVSIADVTAGRAVSMLSGTITDAIATPVPLNINNNSASTAAGTRVNFQFNGSTVGYVGNQFDGTDFSNLYKANREHVFSLVATTYFKIGVPDVTVSSGNLVIGTAGKGIDFSAATHAAGMTSELLNDYEEGTWTPTGNGITYAAGTAGKYTKIGNLVTCTFTVVFPTTANASNAQIQGLPLASSVNSAATFGVYTSGFNGPLDAGNSYIGFINETGTAFIANATLSAKTISGSITYQV